MRKERRDTSRVLINILVLVCCVLLNNRVLLNIRILVCCVITALLIIAILRGQRKYPSYPHASYP